MVFPDPVIGYAIEPKKTADQDNFSKAIGKLIEEDPTLTVETNEETGQTIMRGMGELHLEIIIDRMRREFKVEVNQGAPQVAYKETFTKNVEHREVYKNNQVVKVNSLISYLNLVQETTMRKEKRKSWFAVCKQYRGWCYSS